ncbi:LysE family transporter [Streptomyces sp. NPDC001739]
MTGQWERLGEAGGIEAYVHRPVGEVRGAVVVCSELYGVNAYVRQTCAELASAGYVALAPDYYWRNARRTALGYSAEEREDGLVLMRALDRDELVAETMTSSSMAASRGRIMLKGVGISGLNPKALLLYFSLFPQFINPASGWPVAAQTGLLGALHMTTCALVYLSVGVLARTVLKTRPSAARVVTRVSGAMMIVIGGFLLAERLVG